MSVKEQFSTKLYQFETSRAYRRLENLAENPFDLTKEGNLNPKRIETYQAESCGIHLFYGTEKVCEETMKALSDLALEASVIQKMKSLQSGEVVNYIEGFASDQRQVLHTATRDFFENPNPAIKAKEAAALAKIEFEKMKTLITKIDRESLYTDLIFVGIGGSELGPKAHYLALSAWHRKDRSVHFVSNVDPDDLATVLKKVTLSKTLVVVVSKGGETIETVTNEELLRRAFQKEGLSPSKHFIAITQKGSPMDLKSAYLEVLYLYDWIGGRFCSSSCAGTFVLAFGLSFEMAVSFLKGANAMDKAALNPNLQQNIPLMAALLGIWNRNFLHYPVYAIVPYSQNLYRYAAHIQQVDMESNGKHIDRQGDLLSIDTGPIVFGEPGTSAQHSFYQLLHQGTTIVPVEFIGFKHSQYEKDDIFLETTSQEKLLSNLFAQILALAMGKKSDNPNKEFLGNRPSHLVLANQLTPYNLGALLAYYEHKIAFQGFIWNINSFDQEGVQLGKKLAIDLSLHFAKKRNSALKAPSFPLGEAFLKQLDRL